MIQKSDYKENLTDLLIATLCSARNVQSFRNILYERKLKRYKKESIHVTLSRFHKKGYVKHFLSGWSASKKGKSYYNDARLFNYILSPFQKNKQNENIVAFDIPEKERKTRNWLRNQLKIFNYKMLQQSLWIGPGPLPDLFLKRLNDLHIREKVKIFKIKKKQ